MRNYRSSRAPATSLNLKQRLAIADAVRGLLEERPTITIRELCLLTGAPPTLAQLVRKKWKHLHPPEVAP